MLNPLQYSVSFDIIKGQGTHLKRNMMFFFCVRISEVLVLFGRYR